MSLIAIEFIDSQVKVLKQRAICKLNIDKAYDQLNYECKNARVLLFFYSVVIMMLFFYWVIISFTVGSTTSIHSFGLLHIYMYSRGEKDAVLQLE